MKYKMNELIKEFNTVNANHETTVANITDMLEQRILQKLSVFFSEVRKEKKLSVRQLNLRSKVSLSVINDLEQARSIPRVETLIRLGLALEIGFNKVFEALILNDIADNSEKDIKTDLAVDISKYGYDKNQVSEIMDFIKFVDYKSKNK